MTDTQSNCLSLCPSCPHRANPNHHGPVPPNGPVPSPAMFIGEGPAKDEVRFKCPFAGRTGWEFDGLYLPAAKLQRRDHYVTNAHKCLRGDTLIWMADGSWKPINELYYQDSRKEVMAVNSDGCLCRSRIVKHHQTPRGDRRLISLSYEGSMSNPSKVVVTEDHLVLVRRENGKQREQWVPASDLSPSDHICTGTPGLDNTQMEFLVGTLLGDCSLRDKSITLSHKLECQDYLTLKTTVMGNVRWGQVKCYHRPTPTGSLVSSTSQGLPVLEKLRQSWGRTGKRGRGLDRECINQYFSLTSLIIWFLDDGHTAAISSGSYISAITCTRLSMDDIKFLTSIIQRECRVSVNTYPGVISFGVKQSKWLRRVVSDSRLVPESLAYKLGDAPYQGVNESFYEYPGTELYYAPVLFEEVETSSHNDRSVYCLSTTHNNFITKAGVVHNCPIPGWDNPTKAQARSCADYHLHAELRTVQPSIIIPMGAVACSLFDPPIDLESQHGIPFSGSLYDWEGTIFPVYHPAIGLHEGSWMQVMLDDFRRLGELLGGRYTPPVDQYPDPDHREIEHPRDLERVIRDARDHGLLSHPQCAIDTEATPLARCGPILQRWEPYCFSFSFRSGTGYTIYMDRPELVEEFIRVMTDLDPLWIIHNWLFDKDILTAMEIPIRRFDDTIIRAYNLQRVPKGLKALAFRLAGLKMQDFDDVVTPYSREVVLDWLFSILEDLDQIMLDPYGKSGKLLQKPRHVEGFTTAQYRTYAKLRRLTYDWADTDPWKRWRDWHGHDRDFILDLFPPMPQKSIAHCPREVSTPYASMDADATMRILPHLKSLAGDLRHTVQMV